MPNPKKLIFKNQNALFSEPAEKGLSESENKETWKILVVDDEKAVHQVTKLVLAKQSYEGRPFELLHAYSGKEAQQILSATPDIAIVLLDVIMETPESGLGVVRYLRDTLRNHFVRIILRTGQPSQAPAEEVIVKYQIHDYKAKTELTKEKLFVSIVAALHTYKTLLEIEDLRKNLEVKVQERTRELEEKNAFLDELNREKVGILHVVSHDLRSPLAQIKNVIHILKELPVSEEEKADYYQNISISSDHGLALIQDLMLINRLELKKDRDLIIEPIVLTDFFAQWMPYYFRLGQKKEIELQLEGLPLNKLLLTDSKYFTRILDNLLTNAIKFSPARRKVNISVADKNGYLYLSVQDEGQGIKAEEQPKLFRPFTKLSARPTAGEDSTGLGLSIIKELTQRLGGSISVESEWGEGATFTLRIPFEPKV